MLTRTDQQIKRDIVTELKWDHRVDASDISVNVANGVVTLTGSVPSYTARNFATSDAWGIAGVKRVNNLLTVTFPAGVTVPTDSQIKSSVDSTLTWNPDINNVNIDITVVKGTVTLEGTVDDYWQKWKAEDLVSDLSGVITVENHLTVVPTEDFVDQDIAEDIEAALERNLYVESEDVTVKVENGEATLTGTLPSYYARQRAYSAAANTLGVVNVNNNIVVA
jgi:osmotically-inducible protein OsmY